METIDLSIDPKKRKIAGEVASTVAMVSFAMLFGTLFMGYAVFRAQQVVWPPMGLSLPPLFYPTQSTIVIGISSLFYEGFRHFVERDDLGKAKICLVATLAFGLAFIFCQVKLWEVLELSGVYHYSGIFGSVVFGYTWIHTAHVVLGISSLLYLVLPTFFGVLGSANLKSSAGHIGKFWHFLGIVWLIVYLMIFLF